MIYRVRLRSSNCPASKLTPGKSSALALTESSFPGCLLSKCCLSMASDVVHTKVWQQMLHCEGENVTYVSVQARAIFPGGQQVPQAEQLATPHVHAPSLAQSRLSPAKVVMLFAT